MDVCFSQAAGPTIISVQSEKLTDMSFETHARLIRNGLRLAACRDSFMVRQPSAAAPDALKLQHWSRSGSSGNVFGAVQHFGTFIVKNKHLRPNPTLTPLARCCCWILVSLCMPLTGNSEDILLGMLAYFAMYRHFCPQIQMNGIKEEIAPSLSQYMSGRNAHIA